MKQKIHQKNFPSIAFIPIWRFVSYIAQPDNFLISNEPL